jgi:hypothetical protein
VRRKARVDFVKHTEWSRKSERERAEERLLLTFLLHNNSRNQHQWWRGTRDEERRGETRVIYERPWRRVSGVWIWFHLQRFPVSRRESNIFTEREKRRQAAEREKEERDSPMGWLLRQRSRQRRERVSSLRIGSPAVGLGDTGDSTERSPHSAE